MPIKRLVHEKLPYKPVVDLAYTHFKSPDFNTQRPPVVTLHGLFGSGKTFGSVGRKLSKDLGTEVYNLDLRNHGKSEIAKPYDYLTMARDVAKFLEDKIGPQKPVSLVGFSMGGKVGLLTSLSKAVNVHKCVSIDMPPYNVDDLGTDVDQNYGKILEFCNKKIKVEKGSKGWKDKVIKIFREVPTNKNAGAALYFSQGFTQLPVNNKPFDQARDLDPYIDYKAPLLEMTDLLDQIKSWPDEVVLSREGYRIRSDTPVLFMKGLKSPMIKSTYEKLGHIFPNYEVQEFDTGHVLITEAPDEFYKSCSAFLSA
ncbi:putative hydrolase [Lachancea thermotolerans CBS 6340]|uniref:KLTH0E08866p n=1 Tax=Lachancea thermotolerans (strain ATCC 56472 / CBS 6340 / NRRL Y-8284) TaxID=559295 RepID=C5DI14_LACTC|nr:KLTH0E08866p [Lachancea thermotolerans CBS 6340]CAR23425.1 KLTH0E08866p [Lachancea thermotolerans CBS 6340]